MTLNSFFDGLMQNLLFGGIAAALLIFVMFRKANQAKRRPAARQRWRVGVWRRRSW